MQKFQGEKNVKHRWQSRNGCDGTQVNNKNFDSMNLVTNPIEVEMRQHKFNYIAVTKNLAYDLPSQSFLGYYLYFTTLF